jgi:hypothetical protein
MLIVRAPSVVVQPPVELSPEAITSVADFDPGPQVSWLAGATQQPQQ